MAESGVMRVEVVSPERVLFSGESTQVITRTMEGGEIAFLPGHAAFLGALTENHTRIYLSDGTIQNLAVHLGFVEVGPDHVTILSDAAELEEDIDVAAVRAKLAAEYTYNVASPFLAAERGELDGIIEPSATRIQVIKAMRALRTKRSNLPPKKHGNIPL